MSETSYQTNAGQPAVLYSEPSAHGRRVDEYVAVEAHDGFFSLTWSSDTAATEALAGFLAYMGSSSETAGAPTDVAIIGRGTSIERTPLKHALALVKKDPELQLLRVELTRCTFVWSASGDARFAEIGVMSRFPARPLTRGLLTETGSPSVKRQADDLLKRASKVMAIAVKTA